MGVKRGDVGYELYILIGAWSNPYLNGFEMNTTANLVIIQFKKYKKNRKICATGLRFDAGPSSMHVDIIVFNTTILSKDRNYRPKATLGNRNSWI